MAECELRTILMPTDLSEASWAALPMARMLAERCGAQLVLMSVVAEPPRYIVPGEEWSLGEKLHGLLKAESEAVRADIQQRLDREGVKAQVVVTSALEPVAEILEEARRSKADAIVLATHGRSGFSRWLLGSVAEKVVRLSPIPVLSVRSQVAGETAEGAAS